MKIIEHFYPHELDLKQSQECRLIGNNITLVHDFLSGIWESPAIELSNGFREAIFSWDIEISELSSYNVEIYCSKNGENWSEPIFLGCRNRNEPDRILKSEDIHLDTDILISEDLTKYIKFKITLFREKNTSSPIIKSITASFSDEIFIPGKYFEDNGTFECLDLNVPFFSQFKEPEPMNRHICSATTAVMAMNYLGIPAKVHDTACKVYDPYYDMYGIWWRTAAVLCDNELKTWTGYFSGWDEVLNKLKNHIPVPACIRYKKGELDNAPREFTEGHVVLITGFNQDGGIICRDSAAILGSGIIVYNREQFNHVWFENAGGIGYFINKTNNFFPKL